MSPLSLPPRQFVRHYQLQQTHDDDDDDGDDIDDEVLLDQVLLGKLTLTTAGQEIPSHVGRFHPAIGHEGP